MSLLPSLSSSIFASGYTWGALPSSPKVASNGSGKRAAAYGFWVDLAGSYPRTELPDRIGELIGLPGSQIAFWAAYYGWDESLDSPAIAEKGPKGSSPASDLDDIDCDDMAHDPLEDFYERYRTRSGSRRHITAFYSEAGFASPCEADLSLYRHLLDRYPISASDAALAIGQDPTVFVKYAAAHGVSANRKYERIAIPLGALVHRDMYFAAIVAKHATHVYRTRATPVRTIALRIGMRWADLWAFGARFSDWSLPSSEVLDSIAEVFKDYPL